MSDLIFAIYILISPPFGTQKATFGSLIFSFENPQDARDAVKELDGKIFDGKPMRVEMAKGPNPNARR